MPLMSPSLLSKRTRRNVRQSKNGCFVCRARRKKCDETLPFCLTCQAAGRKCEGYSYHALQRLAATSKTGDIEEAALSSLCFEVLCYGHYERAESGPPWLPLVVQLSVSSPAVRAAMAFFGSVFKTVSTSKSYESMRYTLQRRHTALSYIQSEIDVYSNDFVAAFIASMLLAASEALFGDLINALLHLRGAFGVIDHHGSPISIASTPTSTTLSSTGTDHETLSSLALSMDMHTAWFRLGHPPDLSPSFDIGDTPIISAGSSGNETATLRLLHSCYHFTSRASPYKYRARADMPDSLLDEQSQYLAALRAFLRESDQRPISKTASGSPLTSRMVLRAQCTSTLIYVSSILNPYESFYDEHDRDFSDLVEVCEYLLQPTTKIHGGLPIRYRFEPGIFQPCYMTAIKCRNPAVRQRAINLLSRLGSEGPWNGTLLAAVATRAMELEETDDGDIVPEGNRIHGCSTYTEMDDPYTSQTSQVEFTFCNDVNQMLADGDYEDGRHWRTIREGVLR